MMNVFALTIQPRNIYVILQIVGIVILLGELLYVSLQKPSQLQKHLIVILITLVISFVGYLIELIGTNFESSYIGIAMGYLGKPFALFSSLLLLLEYADIKVNKFFILAVLFFFICLSIIVFTNNYHHLYYAEIVYTGASNIGSPITIIKRGFFWYVYMASSFIIFAAYGCVVVYEFLRCRTKQSKQMAALLFLVVFFSMLGLLLFICGLTYGYDSTLSGILIGSIALLVLFTRYRLFQSLTFAKDKTLEDSVNGYVILDARRSVIFYNKVALQFIPELDLRGMKNQKIAYNKLEAFVDYQACQEQEPIFSNGNVYQLEITEQRGGKNQRFIGATYRFTQITDHHERKILLQNEIDKATAKIANIQREALISLAGLVEARDGNTGEHIYSVSKTAEAIAYSLAETPKYKRLLDSKFINILKECAPLHDIGKIYIPDSILLKNGKLTPEEKTLMQTHTSRGKEIINKVLGSIEEENYLKVANNIAQFHHEWFDGSGYPQGLKGNKIPLCARIVAVADVYDALRMKRSYKEAYPKNKAIEIIKEEAGTHFDPEIVQAFLKIVKNLK